MKKTAAVLAALVATTLGGVALAPQASAKTTLAAPQAHKPSTLQSRALSIAKSKQGAPYRYGAMGPNSFDCSGLTLYSYRGAGHSIARTAQGQFDHVHHIYRSQLKPGDLIFFGGSRSIGHVAMWVGGGKIISAPHSGARVRIEKLWTSAVHYGRV